MNVFGQRVSGRVWQGRCALRMLAGLAACLAWAQPLTAAQDIGEADQPRSLAEIRQKHLEARGGEARLRAIETLIYRNGTYREEGFTGSGNAFMAFARPWFRVVGDPEDPDVRVMEGYDGSAWEWYAAPGVVVRTVGAAAGATRRGVDFDGPFLDTEAKGYELELLGESDVRGRLVWDVLVTYPDGFDRHYFIDRETFLIVGNRFRAPFHAFGEPVRTETHFDAYREVDGVLFPFRAREIDLTTGKTLSEMEWGSIEINTETPRSWFSPPVFDPTPIQELLGHLYIERSDVQAVLETYRQFRRIRPDLDTRSGIEFIGYQMLKMGDHESAAALLETNRHDHPRSADAAFSLARALRTAGRIEAAEAELVRALRIEPGHERARALLEAIRAGH